MWQVTMPESALMVVLVEGLVKIVAVLVVLLSIGVSYDSHVWSFLVS